MRPEGHIGRVNTTPSHHTDDPRDNHQQMSFRQSDSSNAEAADVVYRRGDEDQREETIVPSAVERVTRYEKKPILRPMRQAPVRDEYGDKEPPEGKSVVVHAPPKRCGS
jgi:hypothetical protein